MKDKLYCVEVINCTLEIISIILNMINYSVAVYHIATCDVINLVLKTNNEKLKHCGV